MVPEKDTPPQKNKTSRILIRHKQTRNNMPVLQQDPHREKQTSHAYRTSAAKRKPKYYNMPETAQKRHAERRNGLKYYAKWMGTCQNYDSDRSSTPTDIYRSYKQHQEAGDENKNHSGNRRKETRTTGTEKHAKNNKMNTISRQQKHRHRKRTNPRGNNNAKHEQRQKGTRRCRGHADQSQIYQEIIPARTTDDDCRRADRLRR